MIKSATLELSKTRELIIQLNMKKENKKIQKKIKLAHLIARMGKGGAEENTRYTLQGLDKNKYDLDLIVGEEFGSRYAKIFQSENIKVIKIPYFKGSLHPLYDIGLFFKLISLFSRNKYDMIHTHGTKAGIIGRIAARISGVPIIIHGLHGNALNAFSAKWLNMLFLYFERLTGTFTDAHISVSAILSEKYIKKGIGNPEKYYTVRSGMDLNSFSQDQKVNCAAVKKRWSLSSADFIIGNISRLESLKGHTFLLRVMKILKDQVKDRRIVLLIIGDGKEKHKISRMIKGSGLENHVILAGYCNDIPAILSVMNLLVHTSSREGLPRVMVQAAAAGLPMVAFNVDGIPEIIRNGYNGFLIEPKNIEQLAEKIKIYLNKPKLLDIHGKNSRKIVKDRWTVEGMVKKTQEIYSFLVKEKITRT